MTACPARAVGDARPGTDGVVGIAVARRVREQDGAAKQQPGTPTTCQQHGSDRGEHNQRDEVARQLPGHA
jgi:hypothetical protein